MITVGCLLLGSLVTATVDDPDPAVLVQQLGAARYAERQKSALELVRLGRESLPALRLARNSRDPEIRTQAVVLIDLIESRLLVDPTMVRLDYHDRTVQEIARDLSERAGLPIELSPTDPLVTLDRRFTLESPDAVPFWTAIDRLGAAAGLQPTILPENSFNARISDPRVILTLATQHTPASVSGPFRTVPLSIQHHRDRFLGSRNLPNFPNRIANPLVGDNRVQEQFQISMLLLAEPRLSIAIDGPIQLTEATDDLGQSLLVDRPPAAAGQPEPNAPVFTGSAVAPSQSSVQFSLPLKFPAKPGKVIRSFRGSIPVAVSSRRGDPLVIDLGDAVGKSFRHGELNLLIHDVQADANGGPTIDLTARTLDSGDETALPRLGFGTFRGPDHFRNLLELLDAEGHPLTWFAFSTQPGPDGTRMNLRVQSAGPGGPPVRLRVYELTRSHSTAHFAFDDILMPLP